MLLKSRSIDFQSEHEREYSSKVKIPKLNVRSSLPPLDIAGK